MTLRVIVFISYPLVIIAKFLTQFIGKNNSKNTVSREEVVAFAQIGEAEGVLEEGEGLVISNLVNLKNVKIREIMTPRTVVLTIPETMKVNEFFKSEDFMKHSRVPIYVDNADNISGYILKFDVLAEIAEGKEKIPVSDLKRNAIVVYESFSIPVLFKMLMEAHEHIALVVDEYGVFAGVVTMEDVMETMLGQEILDENDSQADLQQTARDKWKEKSKGLNFNGNDGGGDEKNSD
jgi:CBS domain containing-hemolysin-like protein